MRVDRDDWYLVGAPEGSDIAVYVGKIHTRAGIGIVGQREGTRKVKCLLLR